jgi:prepilin-type N-terminal cleavage/methylation domain-containing protein
MHRDRTTSWCRRGSHGGAARWRSAEGGRRLRRRSGPARAASNYQSSIINYQSEGGFTFLELLATMVLISVLLPVVMQAISLCTQLAGQSRRQIEAVCLAKTRLTELTASAEWENGNARGDFGTDWPGYEWTTTIANWTDATVRQLDLTVSWRSMGRERQVTLSTLVYPQEQ